MVGVEIGSRPDLLEEGNVAPSEATFEKGYPRRERLWNRKRFSSVPPRFVSSEFILKLLTSGARSRLANRDQVPPPLPVEPRQNVQQRAGTSTRAEEPR
jgi:hypothetical protein